MARALFTLPRFNTNLVSLIITQASPHLAPVLALDPFLLGKETLMLLLNRTLILVYSTQSIKSSLQANTTSADFTDYLN